MRLSGSKESETIPKTSTFLKGHDEKREKQDDFAAFFPKSCGKRSSRSILPNGYKSHFLIYFAWEILSEFFLVISDNLKRSEG